MIKAILATGKDIMGNLNYYLWLFILSCISLLSYSVDPMLIDNVTVHPCSISNDIVPTYRVGQTDDANDTAPENNRPSVLPPYLLSTIPIDMLHFTYEQLNDEIDPHTTFKDMAHLAKASSYFLVTVQNTIGYSFTSRLIILIQQTDLVTRELLKTSLKEFEKNPILNQKSILYNVFTDPFKKQLVLRALAQAEDEDRKRSTFRTSYSDSAYQTKFLGTKQISTEFPHGNLSTMK